MSMIAQVPGEPGSFIDSRILSEKGAGHPTMRVAMLLDNPFTNDRRVYREAKALVDAGYDVDLYAVRSEGLPSEETVDGIRVKRNFDLAINDAKRWSYIRQMAATIARVDYGVLHCHDQTMLNLGAKIKKLRTNATLIYDSHELFHLWPMNLSQPGNRWLWLKSYLVRRYQIYREWANKRAIDHLITVNDSLAADLKGHLQIGTSPVVLRNIPEFIESSSRSDVIRARFDISDDDKILVFIGANVYRYSLNLEAVMDQVGNVRGVSLVFICGEGGNKAEIRAYAESKGYKNIYFHGLVKPSQIQEYLSSCDVGLVPTWNKKDRSYWYALDNKLFEYLMAGIPILATRQPEYTKLIEGYDIGVCVNPEEPDAYVSGLKQVIADYDRFTRNVDEAKKTLNWENEREALTSLYRSIAEARASKN
jgi:glycosyltransferase involved in cell wall biosynthesis